MPEFYIYYRARASDELQVMAQVLAWQQALMARQPHCSARLLKRPARPGSDDEQTWMETYRCDGADASAIDPAELTEGPPALAPLLTGRRHVEVFVPCAS